MHYLTALNMSLSETDFKKAHVEYYKAKETVWPPVTLERFETIPMCKSPIKKRSSCRKKKVYKKIS